MNGEKIKGNLLVETLILTIFFKNQTYRKNSAGCLHLKNIRYLEQKTLERTQERKKKIKFDLH